MGNSSTKESRGADPNHRQHDGGMNNLASSSDRHRDNSRIARGSRINLASLGLGSASNNEIPERRETKAEIKARKLEKERAARIVERERSIKEEHVDGGYLVTMGVYTGPEDFNKQIVRHLMVERRVAPFWRGLEDFKEEWTEHQLVAAGRGLPIPAADEIPPEDLLGSGSESPHNSTSNLHNLTVPLASRAQSASSDASVSLLPSSANNVSSSILRPRSKTLASLKTAARDGGSTDAGPREIQLPRDQYVNGQAIEVFLYKDAAECPICFMYYPPYLNKTRCCDQPICSECFVQIKRPDPHPPEHEHNDPSQPAQAAQTPSEAAEAEMLVSEPAACPYCQQSEFGVTYECPPFRRGLAYANPSPGLASFSSAMSSSSSLNSTGLLSPGLTPQAQKRRTTSLSANSPTVITTDRIRPDWAQKLASARSHLARRSAAASALHAAAFVVNGTPDTRGFSFGTRSRFGRNRSEAGGASGSSTPTGRDATNRSVAQQIGQIRRDVQEQNGSRRIRRDDLEELMMAEAIRLSIAAEEERKRKADKEAAKEAKRKAKDDKKKEKKERRSVYGNGGSSASASVLSVSLSSLAGRRRGNSAASHLAIESTPEATPEEIESSNNKGKGVDRNPTSNPSSAISSGIPGARHLDPSTSSTLPHRPSSPTAPDRPSHLRQMSNASSAASSLVDSGPASLHNDHTSSSSAKDSPNASGANLDNTEADDSNGGAGTESMFNFRSLAAMIDHEEDNEKGDASTHIENMYGASSSRQGHREDDASDDMSMDMDESIATLKASERLDPLGAGGDDDLTELLIPKTGSSTSEEHAGTPELMVTPETPLPMERADEDSKQLGATYNSEMATAIMH